MLRTAQQVVLQWLRDAILTGALVPGGHVTTDSIAGTLGVSQQPVREALKVLEGEGQVEYRPRRGYFVAQLGLADLVEIYRIRTLLEEEALRVGLPTIGDETIRRVAHDLTVMEATPGDDLVALAEANRRFHFRIFAAAGMPHLERHIRMLWEASNAYRALYYAHPASRRRVRHEHRRLFDAVRSRDVERAVLESGEHRRHTVEALRECLPG